MRSFLLQIIKITLLLQKGGYCHCDLHPLNIMVTKNVEKVNVTGNPEAYEYYLKGKYKSFNTTFLIIALTIFFVVDM